jgi:ABC-type sugar transport system ATPase subunit
MESRVGSIQGLTQRFGANAAIDDVNLGIQRGGVLSVLASIPTGQLHEVPTQIASMRLWRAADRSIARPALEQFDIANLAGSLSGSQQQRVAIACAPRRDRASRERLQAPGQVLARAAGLCGPCSLRRAAQVLCQQSVGRRSNIGRHRSA